MFIGLVNVMSFSKRADSGQIGGEHLIGFANGDGCPPALNRPATPMLKSSAHPCRPLDRLFISRVGPWRAPSSEQALGLLFEEKALRPRLKRPRNGPPIPPYFPSEGRRQQITIHLCNTASPRVPPLCAFPPTSARTPARVRGNRAPHPKNMLPNKAQTTNARIAQITYGHYGLAAPGGARWASIDKTLDKSQANSFRNSGKERVEFAYRRPRILRD